VPRPLLAELTRSGKRANLTDPTSIALLRLAPYNLVDNALKHSPPGTRVEVSLGARNWEMALVAADQRVGVAPERRKEPFQRYSRVQWDRAQRGCLPISVRRGATLGSTQFTGSPDTRRS
jgi:signal transduction histidine kinase